MKKQIIRHLKHDVSEAKENIKEDKVLMKKLASKKKRVKKSKKKHVKGKAKIRRVMDEFDSGTLHSRSKKGPVVKNRKQAIAIALNSVRKSK